MVAYAREIGLGLSALQAFAKCLNTLPPMNQGSYDALFENLSKATKLVANDSTVQAAVEVREEKDGIRDSMVSVDGFWQRRGHTSHNGLVTAISVSPGKALDIEILMNYCKGCSRWTKEQQGTPEYRSWKKSHKCSLNHAGSAGSMKPEGAVKIFSRSEATRNLRYIEYLGDGNSASFLIVKESKAIWG